MKNHKRAAFTLVEVLIVKREREKMSLLNLSRTRELKAPSTRFLKQCAFTLAEVLIVLGIIGIIAEMTIPTLMQSFQEQVAITSLKNTYSIVAQAYTTAVQENGTPDNWNLIALGDTTGLANLNTIMSKYLMVIKNCGSGYGCFIDAPYKDLNSSTTVVPLNMATNNGDTKFILNNGSSIAFRQWSPTCTWDWGNSLALDTICGEVMIDINGAKNPNKVGVDTFDFYFTKNGIIPSGTALQTSGFTFNDYCNLSKASVPGMGLNGEGCTAWVIYNQNMDYLHCNDLAWNGKSKCN